MFRPFKVGVNCDDCLKYGSKQTKTKNVMRTGTFYLNNNGSRWIHLINGKREKVEFKTNNGTVIRTVNYYESFGNFAAANISYKGRKITVLMDSNLDDYIK